jgi:hypothetical protein
MVILTALSLTGTALAKGHYPPEVKGKTISRGSIGPHNNVEPDILRRPPTPQGAPILPFTGAAVINFIMIGSGLVLAGTALRRYRFRSTL